jgi:PAS domain S-box-containing protein
MERAVPDAAAEAPGEGASLVPASEGPERCDRAPNPRDQEAPFRALFEYAPVGMIVSGMDQRIQQANAAFCKMLGYSEREMVGKTWAELTHPEDLAMSMEWREYLSKNPGECLRLEKRYLHRDGHAIWARLRVAVVQDPDASAQRHVVHAEDITERKLAEQALRNAREFAQATIDALSSHICVLDEAGKIIAVNRAWNMYAEKNPVAKRGGGGAVANLLRLRRGSELPRSVRPRGGAGGG